MRPEQWTKNGVVFATLLFAYWDKSQGLYNHLIEAVMAGIFATALFCLVSSAIYIFNDICDAEQDRRHPIKRTRPIASKELSVKTAAIIGIALILTAFSGSLLISTCFSAVIISYAIMQFLYCIKLKHIVLLDVVIIAAGFVMRAIAGAVALNVRISPWLLICTFLAALFLALCKRRQEKITKKESEQRPILKRYSTALLNILITITGVSTVTAYAFYTFSSNTADRFDTPLLPLTIPFVAFGFVRYICLVYIHQFGERPEKTLFTDKQLAACLILYTLVLFLILC